MQFLFFAARALRGSNGMRCVQAAAKILQPAAKGNKARVGEKKKQQKGE